MKRFSSSLIIGLAALLSLSSCKSDPNAVVLPSISGKPGEIGIVTSKSNWESAPGTALRDILCQDFPFLPQNEPRYDLFNIPEAAFTKVFQVHRNLIFVRTGSDFPEGKFILNKDVWAAPQTVVRIEAPDAETAASVIRENENSLLAIFNQAERDRVITNARAFEDVSVRQAVENMIGGSPAFPNGYSIKKVDKDFMWISYETTYTNQSFLVYSYPYTSVKQFDASAIAQKRDEVTKEQIPCTTENSYMIINPMIAPGSELIRYNGREFVESRGLWEAYNDFMGGPYVSHTFLSQDGTRIIVIDAFVYAPKYKKKNYLKQVESILYSFRWADSAK
ncbi:MAG: DUF4837 family protein [Bacteroidales bacterium]|nr:DUF4837 family protein [Bacteroidales bacterium]